MRVLACRHKPCFLMRSMRQNLTTEQFDIRQDDLSGEATRSLLAIHLAGMEANSAAR
jgi:hypothetical protein